MKYGSITTGIIADGLVFNMDAANRASTIPSSATTKAFNTVTNKSGSFSTSGIYDSSLVTPSFAADADGYITTEEQFNFGNDDLSIGIWVYSDAGTGPSNNYNLLMAQGSPGANTGKFSWYFYQRKMTVYILSVGSVGYPGNHLSTAQNFSQWYYNVLVRSSNTWSVYYNGVIDHVFGSDGNDSDSNISSNVMNFGSDMNQSIQYNGNMGPIHMYDRALSASEILHNYNALKGRFGL
jgi:hypothetical protein